MSVQMAYLRLPISNGDYVYGLETKEAVDELKQLLKVDKLDNAKIEIPKKENSKFPTNICNLELKNFFNNNSGQIIMIISEKNTFSDTLTWV